LVFQEDHGTGAFWISSYVKGLIKGGRATRVELPDRSHQKKKNKKHAPKNFVKPHHTPKKKHHEKKKTATSITFHSGNFYLFGGDLPLPEVKQRKSDKRGEV